MKFKNIKKKNEGIKSPSNSRTITETSWFSFPKINHEELIKTYGRVLKIFVVFIFIVAVVIVAIDFQKNLEIKRGIDSQRKILDKDLNFWKDIISKNQNYPDAYFQTAVLEYRLGDTAKAKQYLGKGLLLNPNSENGRKIEQLLK